MSAAGEAKPAEDGHARGVPARRAGTSAWPEPDAGACLPEQSRQEGDPTGAPPRDSGEAETRLCA